VNNTHETYIANGYVTDGLNQQFYTFYVGSGGSYGISLYFNSPDWERENMRLTHTSFTPPIADFIGNDPGPYDLYPPYPSVFHTAIQGIPTQIGPDKYYVYYIEY
jgi:hypothetical protein